MRKKCFGTVRGRTIHEGSKATQNYPGWFFELDNPDFRKDIRSHVVDRGRRNIPSQLLPIRRPELGLLIPLLRRLR